MALARTLMNGGTYGVNIATGTYGHSNGALKIAMESTEELHEIFKESFYTMNQIELEAIHEGLSLDDNRVVSVMEATGIGVLEKIKTFFKKLWAKIKEFFHTVKRYIDSIFMSGKEFVAKYKSDIDKVKGLQDFKFKMFKYKDDVIDNYKYDEASGTDIEAITSKFNEVTNKVNALKDQTKETFKARGVNATSDFDKDDIYKALNKVDANTNVSSKKSKEEIIADFKEFCENKVKDFRKVDNNECEDLAEVSTKTYEYLRDGASDSNDKVEREFTEVSSLAKTLTNSKASSNISNAQTKIDGKYKKAITAIDKAQQVLENVGGELASTMADCAREYSSAVSDMQSITNAKINAIKEAYKERDGEYKACIMAALTHFKKQSKKK